MHVKKSLMQVRVGSIALQRKFQPRAGSHQGRRRTVRYCLSQIQEGRLHCEEGCEEANIILWWVNSVDHNSSLSSYHVQSWYITSLIPRLHDPNVMLASVNILLVKMFFSFTFTFFHILVIRIHSRTTKPNLWAMREWHRTELHYCTWVSL